MSRIIETILMMTSSVAKAIPMVSDSVTMSRMANSPGFHAECLHEFQCLFEESCVPLGLVGGIVCVEGAHAPLVGLALIGGVDDCLT